MEPTDAAELPQPPHIPTADEFVGSPFKLIGPARGQPPRNRQIPEVVAVPVKEARDDLGLGMK